MKKIIRSRFFLFLILLFILTAFFYNWSNFKVFVLNTIGNISYAKNDYYLSAIYHNNAYKLDQNQVFNYNLWGDYYKLGTYDKSFEYYSKINLLTWSNLTLDTYYNLWNIYYRLWDKEIYDIQKRIDLWKKSLLSYNQVLLKNEDKKARENYNFVNKKLNELINQIKKQQEDYKKEQEKQKNNQNDNEKKEEENKKSETKDENDKKTEEQLKEKEQSESKKNDTEEQKKDGEDTEDVQTVQWWRLSEYSVGKDEDISWLTNEEKNMLDKYNTDLKNEQQQNSIYFGKKNNETNDNQNMLEMFMQDPFFNDFKSFDDSILGKKERDW